MNVGELLRERDRLLGVVEEAKRAKPRIKQLSILITMYGDDEKVSLNGHNPPLKEELYCGKCDEGPYKGIQGLAVHNYRSHGGKYKVAR